MGRVGLSFLRTHRLQNEITMKHKIKQSGFTLIELLVALAITGMIVTGLATSILQIIKINSSSVNRMEAIKQVENALLYINRDAQMAQSVQTSSGSGFPLVITYHEWDSGSEHTITYSVVTPLNGEPKYLQRSETVGVNQANTRVIANYVDDSSELTKCTYDNNLKELTVQLTANTSGFQPAPETRVLTVKLRPIQQ